MRFWRRLTVPVVFVGPDSIQQHSVTCGAVAHAASLRWGPSCGAVRSVRHRGVGLTRLVAAPVLDGTGRPFISGRIGAWII